MKQWQEQQQEQEQEQEWKHVTWPGCYCFQWKQRQQAYICSSENGFEDCGKLRIKPLGLIKSSDKSSQDN